MSRTEHSEVLSSLRALRSENARLEARLEKLEAQQLLATTRAAQVKTSTTQSAPAMTGRFSSSSATTAAPLPVTKPATSADALPPLAVVKLKPKRESAPRLPTVVEVSEPPETISNVGAGSVGDGDDGAEDPNEPSAATLAENQFERGVEMMKTGNSSAGITQLDQFVTDWPRHPKADNALYFSGLALMAQRDFGPASERFERVVASYPAGDAVLDSMLKLADCRLKLNRGAEARATWQKIISTFPGTSAAAQAQARLSNPSSPSAP